MKKKNSIQATRLKSAPAHAPLQVHKLRWQCDPKSLGIKSTNDIHPTREIIGQERAVRALRVGLEMEHDGYNIFVTGGTGTGRTTTIKRLLQDFKNKPGQMKDHCYVYNFKNPDTPIAISLPSGQGRGLKQDMENFIKELLRDIPAVYESQRYQQTRKKLVLHFQERQKSVLKDFERRVKDRGFDLVQVQTGNSMRPDIVPVVNGTPMGLDQIEALVQKNEFSKEQFDAMRDVLTDLEKQMATVFRELRNIENKVQLSLSELEEQLVMPAVDEAMRVLHATYEHPKLHAYFEEVRMNIRNNLERFRKQQIAFPNQNVQQEEDGEGGKEEDTFLEFQVNVLVDNSETQHVSIVIETNPKYKNIFGVVEREIEKGGVWRTDFTKIKAGSLLRADGGYLVLNALDVLIEPGVWQDLKRTLRTRLIDIQTYEPLFGFSAASLKPEPIEINVKVIMIGETEIYHLLYFRDNDFKKIFKIRADFDFEMPKTKGTVAQYVRFIKMICDDEKLLPFSSSALIQIIEFGVRLAGRQKKISTRFNIIADIAREASYWARKEKAELVLSHHVEQALEERIYRVNLIEEKIQEMIYTGTIMIDTEGAQVGQVNGLSVYDIGEHEFGKPSRITARTSLGRNGIINIEREAELSGPTHNKGVAILSGYFRSMFAQNKPLVMDASITFEQSYGGIDGDSASSTEIYAILSSLSEIPIRQDIAVTGSVNQKGEIQPIGGVNLKIEGFYDVCKARGLTGKQGVIIPFQNVNDLMLREEVYTAVEKKKFSIYAVKSIDEGMEILTGRKAGKKKSDNTFEPGTINALADEKIQRYASDWKKFENRN
ncbi:MAG: AAA family ATPase [Ignavibacteriales bacterium]|nr:AAA family ATPase [Ignavibacteriales bacterium]